MLAPDSEVEELDELLLVAVPVDVPEDSLVEVATSVTPETAADEVPVARAVAVVEYCEARAQYWVTRPW